MDLSYGVHHPSFAIRGLSSMNTRPFLTVHRHRYDRIPRLFPAQLQADQLLEPQVVRYENSEAHSFTPRKRKKLFYEHVYNKTTYHESTQNGFAFGFSRSKPFEPHQQEPQEVRNENTQVGIESRFLSNEAWRKSKTEVVPPLCFSAPHLCEALAAEENMAQRNRRLRPLRSSSRHMWTPGYGNLLSSIGSDGQGAFAFSPTGLLSSLTVVDVEVAKNGDDLPVHVLGNSAKVQQVPDFLLSDSSVMYDLVSTAPTSDACGPHMLLATTVNGVSLATYDVDGNQVHWKDQFPLKAVTSTAFNPIFPEEFSVLSEDGLFTGTAERLHDCIVRDGSYDHFADLQPVSLTTSLRFRQIHYGTHPRTVLLSNSHGVWRHDWRTHDAKTAGDVVFNVKEHWSLSKRGANLGPFQPLSRSRGFQMLLATDIALLYIDARMPYTPLLDWSLSLPSVVDHMSVCEVPDRETRFDVVALSSRKHNFLEVFHAVHETQGEAFGFEMNDVKKSWRPPSPTSEMLWSDLPLAHLQKLENAISHTGLLLLRQRKTDEISVVQWSARDGLKAQLLCVGVFSDGEREFEDNGTKRVQYADNSISIWKHQTALVDARVHTTPDLVSNWPLWKLPGSVLHKRTRKMFWKDALDLRERVCCADDDDVGHGRSSTRIPRPYLGDIEFIARCRARLDVGPVVADKSSGAEVQVDPIERKPRVERGENDHDSDIVTQSHCSSEGDGDQMGDFADVFSGGCTVSELARCTRSGLAHCRTPLGVSGLEESVEQSSFVASTTTEWHSTCLELHDGSQSQVDSNEKLPDWVNLSVYCSQGSDEHASVRTSQIPENSEYGILLRRMQSFFFE